MQLGEEEPGGHNLAQSASWMQLGDWTGPLPRHTHFASKHILIPPGQGMKAQSTSLKHILFAATFLASAPVH